MKRFLHRLRFEFLLIALLMVVFNKIFVYDNVIYGKYVWPLNMIVLGVVSLGVYHEQNFWEKALRNILFIVVLAVPFYTGFFLGSFEKQVFSFCAYILFYSFLFFTLMKQVVTKNEVNESVVLGSISGFLLLVIVATFSFLVMEIVLPNSFQNVSHENVPEQYQQFTYFSLVTLSTIGYGDITPISEQARLLAGFWGFVSQFYMVAIVGIIISKYSSKT